MSNLDFVHKLRKAAIARLFKEKFSAQMRITVGSATCENAAGADAVYAKFKELIGKNNPKGVVLGRVGCAGKCDMEPLVTVISKDKIPIKYMKMTPAKAEEVFASHVLKGKPVAGYAMHLGSGPACPSRVISLCGGPTCHKKGSAAVEEAFKEALKKHNLSETVAITRSACQGMCAVGPVAYIYPDGDLYQKLTPESAVRIVDEHFVHGKPVASLISRKERLANRFLPVYGDVQFFGKQMRVTLRNCGVIDPESLDEYLAVMGYEAAAKVLATMTPQEVIKTVKLSGLRGRGGGGFSTGLKWEMTAAEKGTEKYLVCNADEGDPGAFMDRSTIEGDPHTVIEGMIIGAYAIGAEQGFVYIRAEYPLAIERIQRAINDARKAGLLGKNILGSSFNFDIELRLGSGAFVCGEETALIHSIEGHRGNPRPRPPYPSVSGLWRKPTCINNVETFANVPVVILDGPEWFSSIGTEKSKGTKVFALAGDVENTGLIEVPMGTTLRDVIYGVGGGIKGGKEFKAVQTGGPAGGCLPESALDTPVDYDSLSKAGSIMGSGGMIVINSDACMVAMAKYFIDFTQDESCGKCTPCREGTKRMQEILARITEGKGQEGDVEKLLRLADTVKKTSLCGLGQAAPNPVISTITHFRSEYDAHIREKRCPCGVCRQMLHYEIDEAKCVGCGACRRKCPVQCITGEPKKKHVIDQDKCIKCGQCFAVCKFGAVRKQ